MDDRKNGLGMAYRVLSIAAALIVMAVVVMLILTAKNDDGRKEVRVGCIFSGSIGEPGWNSRNYEGIYKACRENGAELLIRENVPEEQSACLSAVNELLAEDCNVIFLSSYGYARFSRHIKMLGSSVENVKFFVSGSDEQVDGFSYYFGRLYQARYLSGIVAGLTTKTGMVGYVASMSNNEVNRGINAFTLGVRSVSPEAAVKVIFTGSWDDETAEKAAVAKLASMSADVIAYQQNREYVPEACDAAGIDFIGTYRLSGSYSDHYLTSIDCDWGKIYGKVIRDVRAGRDAGSAEYWLGVDEGAVGLTSLSANVPLRAISDVSSALDSLKSGKRVFSGVIYDNKGVLRCGEGELISDHALVFDMDWFAEGVEIIEGA